MVEFHKTSTFPNGFYGLLEIDEWLGVELQVTVPSTRLFHPQNVGRSILSLPFPV